MAKLFEYAVIKHEKKNKDNEIVEAAKVLVPRTEVLAGSEQQVGMIAAKAVPDDEINDQEAMDRVEVIVRPF